MKKWKTHWYEVMKFNLFYLWISAHLTCNRILDVDESKTDADSAQGQCSIRQLDWRHRYSDWLLYSQSLIDLYSFSHFIYFGKSNRIFSVYLKETQNYRSLDSHAHIWIKHLWRTYFYNYWVTRQPIIYHVSNSK